MITFITMMIIVSSIVVVFTRSCLLPHLLDTRRRNQIKPSQAESRRYLATYWVDLT